MYGTAATAAARVKTDVPRNAQVAVIDHAVRRKERQENTVARRETDRLEHRFSVIWAVNDLALIFCVNEGLHDLFCQHARRVNVDGFGAANLLEDTLIRF